MKLRSTVPRKSIRVDPRSQARPPLKSVSSNENVPCVCSRIPSENGSDLKRSRSWSASGSERLSESPSAPKTGEWQVSASTINIQKLMMYLNPVLRLVFHTLCDFMRSIIITRICVFISVGVVFRGGYDIASKPYRNCSRPRNTIRRSGQIPCPCSIVLRDCKTDQLSTPSARYAAKRWRNIATTGGFSPLTVPTDQPTSVDGSFGPELRQRHRGAEISCEGNVHGVVCRQGSVIGPLSWKIVQINETSPVN